jgi:hypothetical protein
MPLLDHFRPPLSERRPWESFHATWAATLADRLNRELPEGYVALEQIHSGAPIKIDVATFSENGTGHESSGDGGVATLPKTVWLPQAAPITMSAEFPEGCTVQIVDTEGGRTLVGAIELVSPGNKDRETKRTLFVAKCATYLSRGVGLVIIDVVTSRHENLHNELMRFLNFDHRLQMPTENSIYAVAYRPLQSESGGRIDAWPMPLTIGVALPKVPLSLGAELCLPVDLESSYQDACERRKVIEAVS